MLIDLSCPVENRGVSVKTNTETGEAFIFLKLLNISEKTIVSVSYNIKVFDENDNECLTIPVELVDISAKPKEFFAEDKEIPIDGELNAKSFVVEVTSAVFENGEVYTPSEENTIDCDNSEASIEDAVLLRKLVPDAICFSKEYDDYWRCNCGRANFLDSDMCVRCGRSKEIILANFSSRAALEDTFKRFEEEDAKRLLEIEKEKELKKKKKIKNLFTVLISIAILVLLVVAGYFIRYGIVTLQGNNAVKNKDYFKAYELYSKINSHKTADVMSEVMGNTPSNLMFATGYLAEDDENLYYITRDSYGQPINLVKENKKTKEKSTLTDAAYCCLNTVGDYIYFINKEGNPCRMLKDGNSTEVLLNIQTYYICVIGNDMYYLKTDYDNPKGLTDEQCQMLASQGQMESYTRLYCYNLNSKKEFLVSEKAINMCTISNGRIYYLTPSDTENPWEMSNLISMNLKGKDVKTIVDVPVTSFAVIGDDLYYISYFDEALKGSEITGMSSLDCSLVMLDLKTGDKKVATDKTDLIMDINAFGDSIFLISYNRDSFFNFYTSQSEDAEVPVSEIKKLNTKTKEVKSILTTDISSVNVCGDYIFCVLADGSLARLKTDGSDFQKIADDGTSIVAVTEPAVETK